MSQFRPAVRPLEDRCTPATLVVNTTADDFTADNFLTLREANFLLQGGGSTAGFTVGGGRALTAGEQAQITGGYTAFGGGAADVINFAPSLAGQTITLTLDDPFASTGPVGSGLAFASNTTIDGVGAGGVTISGGGQRRIFDVFGGTLTVRNLTLANGNAVNGAILVGGSGGAVHINGQNVGFTANNVTFRNNTANAAVVGGNVIALGYGGAIANNNGVLTVTNSTFFGNTAVGNGSGGAIAVQDGQNTLTNVTVSGNTAAGGGRGLWAWANGSPGVPTLAINNSIFGQTDASVADVSLLGPGLFQAAFTISGSNNLVRNNGAPGLPAGLVSTSADPLLAPLAFNGGLTPTMSPLGGSPVINAGNNATAANPFDQRGKARVSNGTVDLGAVEVQAAGFAAGIGAGGNQPVRVYNPDGTQRLAISAYAAAYTGGVFVGTGDLNGDGVADIVTSTGKGGSANIRVFDGTNGSLLQSFFAYPEAFTGGVNVALGDVNFDGVVDIVCGVGVGGGPNVRVLDGKAVAAGRFALTPVSAGGMLIASFFAYDASFTGGVRVTVADVNNDGFAEIICGVGSSGGPNVRVFDGKQVAANNFSLSPPSAGGMLINSFFALPSTFTGGLFLASGDMNGDGLVDIVNGVESSGGPNVRAYTANNLNSVSSFFAYDQAQTSGVRVATADVNGDGFSDYITGSGPGTNGQVKVISGKDATTNLLPAFTPFGSLTDVGGVNVG